MGVDQVNLRHGSVQDGVAVAGVFGAARAEMRYVPVLHTQAEHVEFFSSQVLANSDVIVAEVDGQIVGFSAIETGWLHHLYVRPEWQGRGIGAALLGRAVSENASGLSLWAFLANHRAIAFYARAGFVEVLRTDGSDNEEHEPDVQMHWSPGGPLG
jgi:GNAT superfamily N-acetyltransferase